MFRSVSQRRSFHPRYRHDQSYLCTFEGSLSWLFWFLFFFSIRVFFHGHWRLTGQQGKGGDHILFHSTISTRSQTFRHLFATLHVRWLSHIFNRNTRKGWSFSPPFIPSEVFLYRKQPPDVSVRKGVLTNFTKFTGKHLCQSFLLNKVLLKKTPARVFSG